MVKYYRACAEKFYDFSREIFRFASKIKKKVIPLAKKIIKTADDTINKINNTTDYNIFVYMCSSNFELE